mmetsp:Transcript_20385/g.78320  ORF Transcript_20385/g.78320 Transcript_20385/m.78320 type:complete len:220 (+) Transcript_20385:2242-2901(+)
MCLLLQVGGFRPGGRSPGRRLRATEGLLSQHGPHQRLPRELPRTGPLPWPNVCLRLHIGLHRVRLREPDMPDCGGLVRRGEAGAGHGQHDQLCEQRRAERHGLRVRRHLLGAPRAGSHKQSQARHLRGPRRVQRRFWCVRLRRRLHRLGLWVHDLLWPVPRQGAGRHRTLRRRVFRPRELHQHGPGRECFPGRNHQGVLRWRSVAVRRMGQGQELWLLL